MTPTSHGALLDVLGRTRAVLLDFDGPVCRLFAGIPAPTVAEQLRQLVADHGATIAPVPPDDDGPLQVLRRTAAIGDPELTRTVAKAVREAEVAAVATAAPAPAAHEVIRAIHHSGRPLAAVSNNSADAVRAYLERFGLTDQVDHIVARTDDLDPALLKPDPFLVRVALAKLDTPAGNATIIGDSPTDIEAGRAAGIMSIGYANRPPKLAKLGDAGADAVIETMSEIAEALRAIGTAPLS